MRTLYQLLIVLTTISSAINFSKASSGLKFIQPKDTKVRINEDVILQCRIEINPESNLAVQWSIDEFGYTNEGLALTFGGRYSFSTVNGIFDLHIQKVQLKDDTTFSCQIDLNDEKYVSEKVKLDVIVPPAQLNVQQFNIPTGLKVDNIVSGDQRMVKELHAKLDVATYSDTNQPISSHFEVADAPSDKNAFKNPSGNNLNAPIWNSDQKLISTPVIGILWLVADKKFQLRCVSNASKPAVKLKWFLDSMEISSSYSKERIKPIENNDQKVDENDSNEESDVNLWISESILELTANAENNGKRLECRISNPKDYNFALSPVVSSIIKILEVKDVQLYQKDSFNIDLKDGQTVDFICHGSSSATNQFLYIWTLSYPLAHSNKEDFSNELYAYNLPSMSIFENPFTQPQYDNEGSVELLIQNTLEVKIEKKMHTNLLTCWAGAISPDAAYDFRNISTLKPYQTAWNKKSITLNVKYPPIYEEWAPLTLAVHSGKILTLKCQADANPKPSLRLYKALKSDQNFLEEADVERNDVKNLDAVLSRPTFSNQDFLAQSFDGALSYLIKLNNSDDLGIYVCVAKVAGFKPALKRIFVSEFNHPKILKTEAFQGLLKQSVRLVCPIQSVPVPTPNQVSWYKDNHLISNNALVKELIARPRGVDAILEIKQLSDQDFGNYNCTVKTEEGFASAIIKLTKSDEITLAFIIGSVVILMVIVSSLCIYGIIRICNRRRKQKTFTESSQPSVMRDIRSSEAMSVMSSPYLTNSRTVKSPLVINGTQSLSGSHLVGYVPAVEFDTFRVRPLNTPTGIVSMAPHYSPAHKIKCPETEIINESTPSYDSGMGLEENPMVHLGNGSVTYVGHSLRQKYLGDNSAVNFDSDRPDSESTTVVWPITPHHILGPDGGQYQLYSTTPPTMIETCCCQISGPSFCTVHAGLQVYVPSTSAAVSFQEFFPLQNIPMSGPTSNV